MLPFRWRLKRGPHWVADSLHFGSIPETGSRSNIFFGSFRWTKGALDRRKDAYYMWIWYLHRMNITSFKCKGLNLEAHARLSTFWITITSWPPWQGQVARHWHNVKVWTLYVIMWSGWNIASVGFMISNTHLISNLQCWTLWAPSKRKTK